MSENELKHNMKVVLDKLTKKNYVMNGHSNINDKIKELIEQNGSINYDDFDYICSYKSEVYGPFGATFEIEKIHKVSKKLI
jgi:hypothetical protein